MFLQCDALLSFAVSKTVRTNWSTPKNYNFVLLIVQSLYYQCIVNLSNYLMGAITVF